MENVRKPPPKKKPFYSLAEAKQCLANGCFQVNPDCRLDALADFGWSIDDDTGTLVINSFKRL